MKAKVILMCLFLLGCKKEPKDINQNNGCECDITQFHKPVGGNQWILDYHIDFTPMSCDSAKVQYNSDSTIMRVVDCQPI